MARYSIFALIGTAERDWIHVMRTASGFTLCGFSSQEREWWRGDPVWIVRSPHAPLADCPDCLRKFEKLYGGKF